MRNSSGFTLIEVLAALAILATSFYMLLELRQNSLKSAVFTSERLIAVHLARTKMEEALAKGFPDAQSFSENIAGMTVRTNITAIGDESTLGRLRRIDVEVMIDEIRFGEEGRVVLSTIVAPSVMKLLPKPNDNGNHYGGTR